MEKIQNAPSEVSGGFNMFPYLSDFDDSGLFQFLMFVYFDVFCVISGSIFRYFYYGYLQYLSAKAGLATKGLAEHVLYQVSDRVTIRSKETAIVPIFQHSVKGDRVLVYDPKASEVCVKRAVHLVNTSEHVLANGSVNILDAGRFVAQCQFTPMIPGDDQLIELGEDTTVSVGRCKPSELQQDRVFQVRLEQDEHGHLKKCILDHCSQVTTRYSIKNNGTKAAACLYIEHTARTDCGGFSITSTSHCVKQTTGWAQGDIWRSFGTRGMAKGT